MVRIRDVRETQIGRTCRRVIGAGAIVIALASGFFTSRHSVRGTGNISANRPLGGYRGPDAEYLLLRRGGSPRDPGKRRRLGRQPGGSRPEAKWLRQWRAATGGWLGLGPARAAAVTTVCWYDRAGSSWSDPGHYPRDSAAQARDLHAPSMPPEYRRHMCWWAILGPGRPRLHGPLFLRRASLGVNWADPRSSTRDPAGKAGGADSSADLSLTGAAARLFNSVGLYRLGPVPPAPAKPKGLTAAEWNTIWFLAHSSKAVGALMQDIASWRLSSAEARAAGSLGDRPLRVLSAGKITAPPEFLEAWTSVQSDLARLSTRGRQIAVAGGASDLLHDAPDAIVEAVRQVLAEVRVIN